MLLKGPDSKTHISHWFSEAACGALWNTHTGELQNAIAKASELALDVYTRYGKELLFNLLVTTCFLPHAIPADEAES